MQAASVIRQLNGHRSLSSDMTVTRISVLYNMPRSVRSSSWPTSSITFKEGYNPHHLSHCSASDFFFTSALSSSLTQWRPMKRKNPAPSDWRNFSARALNALG